MDKLSEALAQFLEAAISAGFKLPFHVAAVAANGTLAFARYTPTNGKDTDEGLNAEFLAQHMEGDGFAIPVNVMLIDTTGQAARMLIERAEPEFFWPDSLPDSSTSH